MVIQFNLAFIECLLHALKFQEIFKVGKIFFFTSLSSSKHLMQRSCLSLGNPRRMKRKVLSPALTVAATAAAASFFLCFTEETKAQQD